MTSKLTGLTAERLANWVTRAKRQAIAGQVVDRIPELMLANSAWLGVGLSWGGTIELAGDSQCIFSLMSVIKPFLLLYLLEQFGQEAVFQWVGMQPSEAAFNSLDQLVIDRGYPRNPMINSGAIALSERIPGKTGCDRCRILCNWLNEQAGCHLKLDRAVLTSVRMAGRGVNQALADLLAQQGYLTAPDSTLDTYEQICCLSGQVSDLVQLGHLLAHSSPAIAPAHRRIVNAIMLTCGLYEASAAYALRIGLPMKSGISGALLAIVPKQGAIACYSPALDSVGNPIAALAFVETLAQEMELSLF